MASPPTVGPDTPITLKVNFDGVTRRFKLPLRDLVASTLEGKIRTVLEIPAATKILMERYSDSAATYVILDSSNVAVFKQLHRAARAKQKLKIRVTSQPQLEPTPELGPEPEEKKGPKPVTIEDEPEPLNQMPKAVLSTVDEPLASSQPQTSATPADSLPYSGSLDTIIAPQTPDQFPAFIKQWRARGMPRIHLRRDANGVEVIDFGGPASPTRRMVTQAPLIDTSDGQNQAGEQLSYRFAQTASTLSFAELISKAQTMEREEAKKTSISDSPATDKPARETTSERTLGLTGPTRIPFTVCCNSCDRAVSDVHFHCSACDDNDFDLCQDCVDQGITCYGDNHWLIKRRIKDGQIIYSTTQVAPKSSRATLKYQKPATVQLSANTDLPVESAPPDSNAGKDETSAENPFQALRTCNCCVQEFPEKEFLHCLNCEDYDLCKNCFAKDQHGHHPKHGFAPAVKGTMFSKLISSRLTPGRDAIHNAICDGCNQYIRGVRHKCLDCPDWDYCSDCVQNAGFIHPNHRFVALYEPIADRFYSTLSRAVHTGICCDGPLCRISRKAKYIVGERYKCAVCHDVDFCANCEASPANTHNKTHPLIKFKTPVRHVSVTTTGEHGDGQRMPPMGDRFPRLRTSNRSTETVPSPSEAITVNPVQTVVDVKPTEPQQPEKAETVESAATEVPKIEAAEEVKEIAETEQIAPAEIKEETPDLVAIFQHDTIEDGTIMPPNFTFEQTWVLKNNGRVAWPAECSVKFVGGDYMGAVDPAHPAGIRELLSASESTVCYSQLQPGQEFPFTVLMRTPDREGKVISYWRLTTKDGVKFGHKLWCDVQVQAPAVKVEEEPILDSKVPDLVTRSQMIIPKIEHESPASSMHVPQAETEIETTTETDTLAPSLADKEEDFEDCIEDDDAWAEESDNGFLTDEEYDILDASDEEYLSEQQKQASKK